MIINCSLSVLEVEEARNLLIRKAQFESFEGDYVALLNGQPLPAKSKLLPLTPFMDDKHVIRLNSRIKKAPNIQLNIKSPAILPNKHIVTDLIVNYHHQKFAHQFQEAVVAYIRKNYWIIHIRSAVLHAKANCQQCKNQRAKPKPTLMGELPICRLDWGKKPFSHTGMDFFGPLNASMFRKRLKCYCMLFTWMVTRAIHLELVMSLSADGCIMNLRNFLNRHGPIYHLYFDNGTNFHGAHRELLNELKNCSSKLVGANQEYTINWHFHPPAGSHFGGAYERLIQ
jgi:hypothetical protein